jgi:serine/threonine-protein kinase
MLKSLGKYRIDAVLGKGAMGVVYQGFDPHIQRLVALKTIHKDLLRDHPELGLIARFKNEAQAAGRLTHPNIVAVYDYGESDEQAYIAMEYVPSTSLAALLAGERRYPRAMVVGWMTQLLKALDYAHARGVVHRDIKPDNLLIGQGGQLKITDFGIARISASTLTQVGAMVGTPCYMSPEQFRGEVADGRADVFSCGVLLYQMLTGVRPFDGNSFELMHKITQETAPKPSARLPQLGSNYDDLLARAMAKRPDERFQSAQAFLDALLLAHRGEVPNPHDDGTLLVSPAAMETMLSAPPRVAAAAGAAAAGAAPARAAPPFTPPTRAALDTPAAAPAAAHAAAHAPAGIAPPPIGVAPAPTSVAPATRTAPGSLATGSEAMPAVSDSSSSLSGLAGWASEVAPELESMLSSQVGPMARVFLKKTSAQVSSLDDLCASLLQHIPTERGRTEFSSGVEKLKKKLAATQSGSMILSRPGSVISQPPQAAPASIAPAAGPVLTEAAISATEQKLTSLIGPIAKIVCKRAANKTADLHEFYRLVAQHIDNEDERKRFLRVHNLA